MYVIIIGLGKMGGAICEQLCESGLTVYGFDTNQDRLHTIKHENFHILSTLDEITSLPEKRIVLSLLPAGNISEDVIKRISPMLRERDIIGNFANERVDNSHKLFRLASDKNIKYYDCGISGGVKGARYGACCMVGGQGIIDPDFERILNIITVEGGLFYHPQPGAGHYLKMIHNGIEYGMMQAIAEGFEILFEQSDYDYNLEQVASVWNHGSIIESFLLQTVEKQLGKSTELSNFDGYVNASGEAHWTVEEALKLNVAVPIISSSLMMRFVSTDANKFANKLLSAMRSEFGGHQESSRH